MSYDRARDASKEILRGVSRNPFINSMALWTRKRVGVMKTTRFLIEKTLEKPAKSGWDWLTTVTKCFKFLCVALVKTGECRDIPEAAKKLADKAMDRLEEMEKVYGSADNFIERKTSDEILTYSKARIDTKLKALEEKDDADTWVMLADAANHLFFILAKVKLKQSSDGAG